MQYTLSYDYIVSTAASEIQSGGSIQKNPLLIDDFTLLGLVV